LKAGPRKKFSFKPVRITKKVADPCSNRNEYKTNDAVLSITFFLVFSSQIVLTASKDQRTLFIIERKPGQIHLTCNSRSDSVAIQSSYE